MGFASSTVLALAVCGVGAMPAGLEGPADLDTSDSNDLLLFRWGREENIWGVDNLQVATVGSPPHRGLRVTKDFNVGDAVIRVNFDHIISALGVATNVSLGAVFEFYRSEPLYFHFLDGRPILKPRLTLMMMLERAKGRGSKYYHYINNLPQRFSIASQFTDSELEEIEGVSGGMEGGTYADTLKAASHHANQRLRREYDLYFPKLTQQFPSIFSGEGWTYEDFVWARHVIDTRCFGFIREDDSRDVGMIPIADMANHGVVNVTWRSVNGAVELYTGETFKKGDEFLLNYGSRSNAYLLEHYGFLLPNNGVHDHLCDKTDYECLVKKLHAFKTSVGEDLQLLEQPIDGFNKQNAIKLRLEEKMQLLGLELEEKNINDTL